MATKPLERITGSASLKRYFDSDYIGAYSLDEGVEPVLTIDSLWYGEITLAGGRKEPHVVVRFKEKSVAGVDEVKPLILNATNRKTLKKLYGNDSAEALEGKRIQFYIDPKVRDPEGGGLTEGLRIRNFVPRIKGDEPVECVSCNKEIKATPKYTAAQLIATSTRRYGKPLCASCLKAIQDASASTDESEVKGDDDNEANSDNPDNDEHAVGIDNPDTYA